MRRFAHRSFVLIAFVLVLFGSSAYSQQTISDEKKALIRDFMEAMGGTKMVTEMMQTMSSFEQTAAPQMMEALLAEDKTLTPAEKDMVRQQTMESAKRIKQRTDKFFAEINIAQMIEEISFPLYDKHFTESELREMTAFYRTPAGQKVISVAPKLTMDAMMAFTEKFTPKIGEFMKKVVEEEMSELKKKLKEPAPQKSRLKT